MATLEEIRKLDSMSQVSDPKKSIEEKNPGNDVTRLASTIVFRELGTWPWPK